MILKMHYSIIGKLSEIMNFSILAVLFRQAEQIFRVAYNREFPGNITDSYVRILFFNKIISMTSALKVSVWNYLVHVVEAPAVLKMTMTIFNW